MMEIPFQNKVENLTWVGYDAEKHCGGCAYFFSTAFANPGGWCAKHPSQQVNCGEGDLCSLWEDRKLQRNEKVDFSFLKNRGL